MQNQIQIFENKEFGQIRAFEKDGQPWFVGKDVAATLGYERPTKAVKDHVDDEDRDGIPIQDSIGRKQNTPIINESGLYSLIFSSKLPTAKAFKRWVTSEILPSIRKYGGYVTDNALDQLIDNPETAMKFFNTLKEERSKKEELEGYIEKIELTARYYDMVLQCPDAVQVSIIAKDYGYSAVVFNSLLHAFGVQYKVGKTWLMYSEHDSKGYTVSRTYQINETVTVIHTCFTQKGRFFIYNLLKCNGILPLAERAAEKQEH